MPRYQRSTRSSDAFVLVRHINGLADDINYAKT